MTIAFSTKSNKWTTRYSFEPQHYFHVDQQLLSFAAGDVADMLWRHDATESYNRFYGTYYPSEFSVVSNENPSATKEYEAFSIEESNYAQWTVEFESASGETGTVSSSGLVKKEGDFYAPIPRSEGYDSGRLIYLGSINPSEFTAENINNKNIPMAFVDDYFAKGPLVIYTGGDVKLLKFDEIGEFNVISLEGITDKPGSDDENFIFAESIDSGSLTIKTRNGDEPELTELGVSSLTSISDATVPVYAVDTSSGLSMRGDWLKATFKTASTSSPKIEVYAVNIDQHNISLDHSLGQNN
jgi:hypothetical protein